MDIISGLFSLAIIARIIPWIIIITTIVLVLLAIFSINKSLKEISTKLGKMNAILATQIKQQNIDSEENQADSVTK